MESRQPSYDPEIFVATGTTFVDGDETSISIFAAIPDLDYRLIHDRNDEVPKTQSNEKGTF
jgi:hypothetical protein